MLQRRLIELNTLVVSRLYNCHLGGISRKSAYLRKIEKALCVGFGPPHPSWQLWQPSANKNNRQTSLGCPMQRGDQGSKLLLFDILKFIHEDGQGSFCFFGGSSCNFKQCLKIVLKITVVRQSGFRGEIKSDLDIVKFCFQSISKTRQSF